MTDTNKPLGGLLKDLARGPDGHLFKPEPTTGKEPNAEEPTAEEPTAGEPTAGEPTKGEPNAGESSTREPTNLDVIIDAALTDPTDSMYKDKMNTAEEIIKEYIKTSKTKADEIKSFLDKYSDPKNITTKDVSIFAKMIEKIQNLNANSGNSLTESFKNDKPFLQNNSSESKATLTEGVSTTMSKMPFRGGQTGDTVGMFDSFKSMIGIQEYWNKNATYTYFVSTVVKKYNDITDELFDKKYDTKRKIGLLKAKLLEKQITHNFKDDDIRQIIIISPGFYSSKEEDTEKAVDIASDFIKHLIQTDKQVEEITKLNETYTDFRNGKKITELQSVYPNFNKKKIEYIIKIFKYNLKHAKDFIEYYISKYKAGLSEKYKKQITRTVRIEIDQEYKNKIIEENSSDLKIRKSELDENMKSELDEKVKSRLDEKVKPELDKIIYNMFIKGFGIDDRHFIDEIEGFKKNEIPLFDNTDDIVLEPFGIDTTELSGLSFALAKVFNFLKGVLSIPLGLSGSVIIIAIAIAELAVKPGLLAVDLTASTIAALFQNIKDAKVGPASNGTSGGSKKIRHRKKNTKKNKKRKRRNTNRK